MTSPGQNNLTGRRVLAAATVTTLLTFIIGYVSTMLSVAAIMGLSMPHVNWFRRSATVGAGFSTLVVGIAGTWLCTRLPRILERRHHDRLLAESARILATRSTH